MSQTEPRTNTSGISLKNFGLLYSRPWIYELAAIGFALLIFISLIIIRLFTKLGEDIAGAPIQAFLSITTIVLIIIIVVSYAIPHWTSPIYPETAHLTVYVWILYCLIFLNACYCCHGACHGSSWYIVFGVVYSCIWLLTVAISHFSNYHNRVIYYGSRIVTILLVVALLVIPNVCIQAFETDDATLVSKICVVYFIFLILKCVELSERQLKVECKHLESIADSLGSATVNNSKKGEIEFMIQEVKYNLTFDPDKKAPLLDKIFVLVKFAWILAVCNYFVLFSIPQLAWYLYLWYSNCKLITKMQVFYSHKNPSEENVDTKNISGKHVENRKHEGNKRERDKKNNKKKRKK